MRFLSKIQSTPFNRLFATLLIVVMSVQMVFIESLGVSPVKVSLMAFSAFVFLFCACYFSKAVLWAVVYWGFCCFTASFHEYMRFSTLGYMGLFLVAYVTLYNLIHSGIFTLEQFKKLLQWLLYSYCIVLLIQQVCVLVGIRNLPIINLFDYYKLGKLPSLSCEPSHTARVIVAAMLGYVRCLELQKGRKITLKMMFDQSNRKVVLAYLWLTFTMGSGTGFIGLGILCFYFIRRKTMAYVVPAMIILLIALQYFGNKQFERALRATEATFTGNTEAVYEADVSGAVRIVPVINTLTGTNIFELESWVGNGTMSDEVDESYWRHITHKISIVEQYGLLGFIASLILLFSCAIRRIWSLETLCFMILLMCTLSNEYFSWSMIYIFTGVRYFQEQKDKVKQKLWMYR